MIIIKDNLLLVAPAKDFIDFALKASESKAVSYFVFMYYKNNWRVKYAD